MKNVSKSRSTPYRIAGFVSLVWLSMFAPTATAGSFVELGLGNDLGSGNSFVDDHYTAAFRVSVDVPRVRIQLEERMFTDRAVGIRFDETYAGLAVELPQIHGWRGTALLGAMHLGQGLFGEQAQNGLHKWLNNRHVDLSYPNARELKPFAGYALHRRIPVGESLFLLPRLETFATPGFRSHAALSLGLRWAPRHAIALEGGPGVRMDRTDYSPLRTRVRGSGPTFSIAAILWRRCVLSWTFNEYGLMETHYNLGVRIPIR